MSRQHVKRTRNHHKLDRRMRKLKRSSGLFIAPSFLGVLAFFFLPFLVVIFYSLVDNPISMNFVFLDNFRNVVQNAAFRTAVHNTAVFSAIAVPLAVVLSLRLAIVLESKLPYGTGSGTEVWIPIQGQAAGTRPLPAVRQWPRTQRYYEMCIRDRWYTGSCLWSHH